MAEETPLTANQKLLLSAISKGDVAEIANLTTRSATNWFTHLGVEDRLPGNDTFLIQAMAKEQGAAVVNTLLDGMADQSASGLIRFMNATDNDGNTALIYAASYNNVGGMQALMDAAKKTGLTLDLHKVNSEGHSALSLAINLKNFEAAEMLVNAGVGDDYLYGPEKRTLMALAVDNADAKMVAMLAAKKPELITVRDGNGDNALDLAAYNNKPELIRAMLDGKSPDEQFKLLQEKNANRMTAIEWATQQGHTESVRALVQDLTPEHKAQLFNGKTLVDVAARNGKTGVIQEYINQGASFNVESGSDALWFAARNQTNSAELIQLLKTNGADVNGKFQNKTMLQYLVEMGDGLSINAIKALTAQGADPTIATDTGESLKDLAKKLGKPEIIKAVEEAEEEWKKRHPAAPVVAQAPVAPAAPAAAVAETPAAAMTSPLLTVAESTPAQPAAPQAAPQAARGDRSVSEIFKSFDADGNGRLSKDELASGMRSPDTAQELLRAMDVSKNVQSHGHSMVTKGEAIAALRDQGHVSKGNMNEMIDQLRVSLQNAGVEFDSKRQMAYVPNEGGSGLAANTPKGKPTGHAV